MEGDTFEQTKQTIMGVLDNMKYNELVEGWVEEYETSVEDKYFNALAVTPYSEDEEITTRMREYEIAQQQKAAQLQEQNDTEE